MFSNKHIAYINLINNLFIFRTINNKINIITKSIIKTIQFFKFIFFVTTNSIKNSQILLFKFIFDFHIDIVDFFI